MWLNWQTPGVSSLMISKNPTDKIPKLVPIATTDDAWLYYVWFPKHRFSSSLRFSSCLFVKLVLWKACSIERLQKLILHLFLSKTRFFAHRFTVSIKQIRLGYSPDSTAKPSEVLPQSNKRICQKQPTRAHQVEVANPRKNNRLILLLCKVENLYFNLD